MVHGGGHRTRIGVVREFHSEVAVHGGRVEFTWVAVAECLESLVVLGAPGENCATIIYMSVEDDEDVGVFGTGDLELA